MIKWGLFVEPYFWWVEMRWRIFWVVGCFWGIILGRWEWFGKYFGCGWGWVGHYFGWAGVYGKIFWVARGGWGEWGWLGWVEVHCFIIPFQHGLIPTVNKPTHVKRNIVSAIDHMIPNSVIGDELKTGIMNTDISTCLPMFFIFKGVVFSWIYI